MKYIFISIIRLYQRTLSPDHGILKARYPFGFCRFYPSCSQYAIDALESQGLIRGLMMGVKRIFKCNPFARPGIDIVPKQKLSSKTTRISI